MSVDRYRAKCMTMLYGHAMCLTVQERHWDKMDYRAVELFADAPTNT